MANQASAELFLDILTKEEREALLNKKMEELRKKNEALRKRHEEIQNDKKVADQLNKPSPPTNDSSNASHNKERRQTYPNETNFTEKPKKNNKSAGRGKPRPKSGGDFNHVQDMHIVRSAASRTIQLKDDNDRFQNDFRHETPKRFSFGENDHPKDFKFGAHDDHNADFDQNHNNERKGGGNRRNFRGRGGKSGGDHYKENRSDHYNRQESRSSNEDKRDFRNSGDFSRQDSWGRGRGRNNYADQYNRQDSRSSGEDIYDKREFRNSGDFSRQDSRGRGGQSYKQGSSDGNQYNRQGSNNGNRYSGEFTRNNYKEKREQFDDSEYEPTRKRPHGGSHNYHEDRPEGPPPDPAYNFLSDRSREGPQSHVQERREPARRHPKNFGGQDFSNVKNQMKNVKERQQNRGPPKSKMELAVTMTGKERRQYIEWKADRDRVDNARIERQKSSSGEWKREWDKEKIETDEIKQTEPAKRPAGRIGSGRFDRGEKDERQKGDMTVHLEDAQAENSDKGHQHTETPTKSRGDAPSPRGRGNRHPEMPPRMAGRGRGRGRGKAKSANEAKPQRVRSTSSGDERIVNCDSDLLVIKLENVPGDNSVEVEYSDGEVPVAKPRKGKNVGGTGGTTATHGAQTEELWWDEDDDLTMSLIQDGLEGDEILEHRQLFDDNEHCGSHEVVVGDDEDEWEDCDDDYYSTEKSQTSTDSRDGLHDKKLKVNTQLNPDAPEFTPTSPLSPASPRSPRDSRRTARARHSEHNGNESSVTKEQSKAAGKTENVSPKDSKKNVGKNSKTDQKAIDNDVAFDQKGTETKKDSEKCKNTDDYSCCTADQKACSDNNVAASHDTVDLKVILKDGGDVEEACHIDGGKADKVSSSQISSSIDDHIAHSETANRDSTVDSASAEGTVTENKQNITNADSSTKDTNQLDTSVEDTRNIPVDSTDKDSNKGDGGADDTTKVDSGAEDTTKLNSTLKQVDSTGDGTLEQMAKAEIKNEGIVKEDINDEASTEDKKGIE